VWSRLKQWWAFRRLARQARSQDAAQRRQAAATLAQSHTAPAVQLLAELFRDPDPSVAEVAGEGLLSSGPLALEPLLTALHGSNPQEAERAAKALGRLGDRRATAPLLAALKFGSHELRLAATRALETLPDLELEHLLAALADTYPYVKNTAGEILLNRGAAAVPGLLSALDNKEAEVRQRAAVLLGKIGDSRAREGLTAAAKDEDADVRKAAQEALAGLAR